MNATAQTEMKPAPKPSLTPVHSNLLQRKCACGGTPGPDGECAACRSKRLALQRRATSQSEPSSVPPIVHEVLRSPGQPLDPTTRASMEPRFGHDFSGVRVHTDARAAESANAVNARAYVAGQDAVFAAGQYSPATPGGRKLLAHELAHVVQQRGSGPVLRGHRLGSPGDAYEHEADRTSEALARGEDAPGRLLEAPVGLQRLVVEDPEEIPLSGGPATAPAAAPAPAAPAATCAPAPVATLAAFNNSGAASAENCCAVCPIDLGVGAGGAARNGMEMRIEIANHCPGAEYEITRVRESWLWHRVGGVWSAVEHQGPGVNDDHHDDDECHRLRRGRFLYVIDSPGYPGIPLPAPEGRTFAGYTGVTTDPAATEVVAQDTFAEWVIYRHRAHGIPWTPISTPRFFYWRSVLWLQKTPSPLATLGATIAGPAGAAIGAAIGGPPTWRLTAASEIRSGYRSAVVSP